MPVPSDDVAVLGSGFAGAALAAILARQGLSVVVLEAGVHPRFAIGESMILETSETLRAMAEWKAIENRDRARRARGLS